MLTRTAIANTIAATNNIIRFDKLIFMIFTSNFIICNFSYFLIFTKLLPNNYTPSETNLLLIFLNNYKLKTLQILTLSKIDSPPCPAGKTKKDAKSVSLNEYLSDISFVFFIFKLTYFYIFFLIFTYSLPIFTSYSLNFVEFLKF